MSKFIWPKLQCIDGDTFFSHRGKIYIVPGDLKLQAEALDSYVEALTKIVARRDAELTKEERK